MKILLLLAISFSISGCLYKDENGFSFFKPYYMDRNRTVTADDIKILDTAALILDKPEHWGHDYNRLCLFKDKWSLFCALAKASIDVTGEYKHRRVAMQEVRFTVNEQFPGRWKIHQLMDFNNHKDTTYLDIRKVLDDTKKRLEARLNKKQ